MNDDTTSSDSLAASNTGRATASDPINEPSGEPSARPSTEPVAGHAPVAPERVVNEVAAAIAQNQAHIWLRNGVGDEVVVALHGGQVLSWRTVDGVERLYLSPNAVMDSVASIRGGVPVCFPQFNQRGPLAKHGFARNRAWRVRVRPSAFKDMAYAELALADDASSLALWPHSFEIALRIELRPGELKMELQVRNRGTEPWAFTAALHTYLRTQSAAATAVHGLHGLARWDANADTRGTAPPEPLRFAAPTDHVYTRPEEADPLYLLSPDSRLQISQSNAFGQIVIWNPGTACADLPDMLPDAYQHMLCIEAAQIDEPVQLQGGQSWRAWQLLQVLPS